MKTRLTLWLLAAMLTASAGVWADETITVSAQSEDISQNLDLKAVATVFGQSADLEQFERSLNDYENRINNLDLNGDGEVDYLRVVETGEGDKRLVVIQAVLAQDIYQDVASIMVEKDRTSGQTVVQIVGDEYIYGTNYIIEPVYLHVPVIYDYFWRPYYSYWVSPYYWGYWPSYWTPFTCWAVADYWWHINAFHRHHHFCSYRYAPQRRRGFEDLNRHVARHDLATRQPEHGFSQRNQGMQNSRDIVPNRTITNRTLASGGNAGAYQQNTGRVVRSQSEFNASRGNSTATRYNTGSRSGAATTGSRGTSTSYSTGSRNGAATTVNSGTSTSYSTGSRGTSTSYNAGTRSSAGTSTSYSSGTRGTSTSYNAGTRGTSSSFSGSRSSAGSSSSYSSGSRGMSGGYSSGSYSSGSRSSVGSGYSGGGRSSGGGFSGGGSHSSGGGSHGGGGTGRR